MMKIVQSGQFRKSYKKLHPNQLPEINAALEAIIENPGIGEQKKGDLSWLRVYKCKALGQLTLIGYCASGETRAPADDTGLAFVALGSHKNFYRDIKKHGASF